MDAFGPPVTGFPHDRRVSVSWEHGNDGNNQRRGCAGRPWWGAPSQGRSARSARPRARGILNYKRCIELERALDREQTYSTLIEKVLPGRIRSRFRPPAAGTRAACLGARGGFEPPTSSKRSCANGVSSASVWLGSASTLPCTRQLPMSHGPMSTSRWLPLLSAPATVSVPA